jgi:3-oxoadipate enol-lactonase
VSTFSVLRPKNISGWFYFLQRLFAVSFLGLTAQAKIVARRVFPDPNQEILREYLVSTIAKADVHAYKAAMRSLSRFDSHKWLPQLNVPVLVISGTEDTTVLPQQQKTLAELIPGARQICIPNAGHAVNIDQADEFNRILLDFIA